MKKSVLYFTYLLSLVVLWGCKKEGNYPGGKISPYISIFDVRSLYKGAEVTLTKENLFGSDKITGIVVSDHSGGNLPAGLLIVQDKRRLGRLRGIAIPLGNEAASFMEGDSVAIDLVGATLKKTDGILQLAGITKDKITKISSGNTVTPLIVKSSSILNNPGDYESILLSVTKVGFDAALPPNSTYAGDRIINDGFGNITLHTEAGASFANDKLPFLANYTGIVFNRTEGKPELWARKKADIMVLSATAPKVAAAIITGYLIDPTGSDANYEYIQLLATKDINFATTPFALVTTNNAGSNTPTGFPVNGWATGGLRTYKFNLTSGTVQKGQYFYVGANKNIWGAGSTDISSSKWFGKMYATEDGDVFGTKTTNLLANSGNAAGIAVFDKIDITEETVPIDVIFYGGSGSVYTPGPPERGYRITNTDYYDITNPTTLADQPFFNMGSNTGKLGFPPATNFAKLGGTYNKTSGRWTAARFLNAVVLTATSTVAEIEGATTIEE